MNIWITWVWNILVLLQFISFSSIASLIFSIIRSWFKRLTCKDRRNHWNCLFSNWKLHKCLNISTNFATKYLLFGWMYIDIHVFWWKIDGHVYERFGCLRQYCRVHEFSSSFQRSEVYKSISRGDVDSYALKQTRQSHE